MEKILMLADGENIKVKLEDKIKGLTLSIMGLCKNSGGQNYDEIYDKYISSNMEFKNRDKLIRLIEIWKEYHLNDLTPGTLRQMEALKDKNLDYTEAVEYLKELNLYIDSGYSYGSAWLFKEIPNEIIIELNTIMETW